MSKLGQYHDDDRGHYNFSYGDNDGKHISVSFRAESEYDLDIVFNEIRNFLIASGHDVEGPIGELYRNDEDDIDYPEATVQGWVDDFRYEDGPMERTQFEPKDRLAQVNPTQDKFSMDHLPNNGWPFGTLATASIAALTTADLSPLTVTNLDTNETYAYRDMYSKVNQFPTMSPLTSQQVNSWSLSSSGIQALTSADLSKWRVDAPGTIGGAKVNFK